MSFGSKRGIESGSQVKKYKDEKGHYERWELRVHPDLDTAARTYLSDPSCEFESMSELIRGCVLLALPQLRSSRSETRSVIAILRAIEEENRRSEMRRRFEQHISETAREAFELVSAGRTDEAAKHIHKVLLHVRDMEKSDPWREEYQRIIKNRFGHLLRLTKAASFLPDWEDSSEEESWQEERGSIQ